MDMSAVAVIILSIWKDFHSGILKLFEGNFNQRYQTPHYLL